MAKYKALRHIIHEGQMHQPESEITLTDKAVIKRLTDLEAIEEIKATKKVDEKDDKNTGDDSDK